MADETDNSDVELVDYNPELFVSDGELWVRDRDAFATNTGFWPCAPMRASRAL